MKKYDLDQEWNISKCQCKCKEPLKTYAKKIIFGVTVSDCLNYYKKYILDK